MTRRRLESVAAPFGREVLALVGLHVSLEKLSSSMLAGLLYAGPPTPAEQARLDAHRKRYPDGAMAQARDNRRLRGQSEWDREEQARRDDLRNENKTVTRIVEELYRLPPEHVDLRHRFCDLRDEWEVKIHNDRPRGHSNALIDSYWRALEELRKFERDFLSQIRPLPSWDMLAIVKRAVESIGARIGATPPVAVVEPPYVDALDRCTEPRDRHLGPFGVVRRSKPTPAMVATPIRAERRSKMAGRIVRFLRAAPAGLSARALRKKLRCGDAQLAQTLETMSRDRVIERTGNNNAFRYILAVEPLRL